MGLSLFHKSKISFCPFCGASYPFLDEDLLCPECNKQGIQVWSLPKNSTSKKCPNCHGLNSSKVSFCMFCGQNNFTSLYSPAFQKMVDKEFRLAKFRVVLFLLFGTLTFVGLLLLYLTPIYISLHYDPATLGDPYRPINGYVFNFLGHWKRYVNDEVVAEGTRADWVNFPPSAPILVLVGGVLVFPFSVFLYYRGRIRSIIFAFLRVIPSAIGFAGMLLYAEFGLTLSSSINYFEFSFSFSLGMAVFLSHLLLSVLIFVFPNFFVINYSFFTKPKFELIRDSYLKYNINNPSFHPPQ